MLGARWASGDHANANNDEGDAGPALRADVLMQPEDGKQHHDDIADGSSGQNVGEIGKGERRHVTEHERQQKKDSYDDKRVREHRKDIGQMVNVDGAGVLHPARQKGISHRAEEYHGENDEIFTKRQSYFSRETLEFKWWPGTKSNNRRQPFQGCSRRVASRSPYHISTPFFLRLCGAMTAANSDFSALVFANQHGVNLASEDLEVEWFLEECVIRAEDV